MSHPFEARTRALRWVAGLALAMAAFAPLLASLGARMGGDLAVVLSAALAVCLAIVLGRSRDMPHSVGNVATGHDANNNEPDKCSQINNGQNETGSGGNGGALYSDGASVDVTICGSQIVSNAAGTNAFGGGLFFTSNDYGGTLTFRDTTMTGNTGGYWTQVAGGSVTNTGTAVGTNAKSITIANSTLQGL